MMALGLGDYVAITGIVAAVSGLPMTAMLFAFKRLWERVDRHEKQIEKIVDMKVDKQDWLRESLSTRMKVDAVGEQIAVMTAKMDSAFGMSAAVNRMADLLAKLTEQRNA